MRRTERRLDVILPEEYVALMSRQDGGHTRFGTFRDPKSGRVHRVFSDGLVKLMGIRTLAEIASGIVLEMARTGANKSPWRTGI